MFLKLNVIDCFYEQEKCTNIQYTPTWIINGQKYEGFQSIEKLKELTGCQMDKKTICIFGDSIGEGYNDLPNGWANYLKKFS